MKLNEKIKNAWNELNKHWLWVNIGAYMILMIINWTGFFLNAIKFEITFLITVIYPIIILTIYYIRKSKYQRTIHKVIWIVGGGLCLGFPIWALVSFLLMGASWAPLNDLQDNLRVYFLILSIIPSYSLAVYIMYRIGKKRDWAFPSY